MLSRLMPPELAAMLRPLRIAVEADALAPWKIIAIALATVLAAAWMESREYARRGKPVPGFRAGVLMGLAVATLAGAVLGWLSYGALASGAIKCMSRHCHGTTFTDVLGHRHFEGGGYVSMTFDPPAFWITYATWSCFTLAALFGLCSCLRAVAHWKALD